MTIQAHAHLAGTAALLLLAATIQAKIVLPMVPPNAAANALLAWKASLVDKAALSSWRGNGTRQYHDPACTWVGVACRADHVIGLALAERGLSGGIGSSTLHRSQSSSFCIWTGTTLEAPSRPAYGG
jgi:hypothetical protein